MARDSGDLTFSWMLLALVALGMIALCRPASAIDTQVKIDLKTDQTGTALDTTGSTQYTRWLRTVDWLGSGCGKQSEWKNAWFDGHTPDYVIGEAFNATGASNCFDWIYTANDFTEYYYTQGSLTGYEPYLEYNRNVNRAKSTLTFTGEANGCCSDGEWAVFLDDSEAVTGVGYLADWSAGEVYWAYSDADNDPSNATHIIQDVEWNVDETTGTLVTTDVVRLYDATCATYTEGDYQGDAFVIVVGNPTTLRYLPGLTGAPADDWCIVRQDSDANAAPSGDDKAQLNDTAPDHAASNGGTANITGTPTVTSDGWRPLAWITRVASGATSWSWTLQRDDPFPILKMSDTNNGTVFKVWGDGPSSVTNGAVIRFQVGSRVGTPSYIQQGALFGGPVLFENLGSGGTGNLRISLPTATWGTTNWQWSDAYGDDPAGDNVVSPAPAAVETGDLLHWDTTLGTTGGYVRGPYSVAADPCGTVDEATLFYNTVDNYMCFCDDAAADVQMHDPATACF